MAMEMSRTAIVRDFAVQEVGVSEVFEGGPWD